MSKINAKVVLNTKGGVGKSTISYNVMPVAFDNAIIYQIDSSNDMEQENSKLQSKNFGSEVVKAFDNIDFTSLTSKKDVSAIIDVGAGEDTRLFLKQLETVVKKNEIEDIEFEFYIPINHNLKQSKNLKDTISEIKEVVENPKIFIILNRCQSLNPNEIKEQFKGYFGNEYYKISSSYDENKEDIAGTIFIKDEIYFDILENEQVYFPDVLPDAVKFLENWSTTKKEVAKKKDDVLFGKLKDDKRKMEDLVEIRNIVLSQFGKEK